MNLFSICGCRCNEGKSCLMYAIDFSFNCNCYFPEDMFERSWVSVREMAPDTLQNPSENNQITCLQNRKKLKTHSVFLLSVLPSINNWEEKMARLRRKQKPFSSIENKLDVRRHCLHCRPAFMLHYLWGERCWWWMQFTITVSHAVPTGLNRKSHNAMHWWRSHKARPRLITIPLSLTYLTMSHRIHRLWLRKLSQQSSVILRNNQMDMGPRDGHTAVILPLVLSGNKI